MDVLYSDRHVHVKCLKGSQEDISVQIGVEALPDGEVDHPFILIFRHDYPLLLLKQDGLALVKLQQDGLLGLLSYEFLYDISVYIAVVEGEEEGARDDCLHVHCAHPVYLFEEEADVAGQVVDECVIGVGSIQDHFVGGEGRQGEGGFGERLAVGVAHGRMDYKLLLFGQRGRQAGEGRGLRK